MCHKKWPRYLLNCSWKGGVLYCVQHYTDKKNCNLGFLVNTTVVNSKGIYEAQCIITNKTHYLIYYSDYHVNSIRPNLTGLNLLKLIHDERKIEKTPGKVEIRPIEWKTFWVCDFKLVNVGVFVRHLRIIQ